jgi:hypothetical protein
MQQGQDDVEKSGSKIDDLLDYRRTLETEQGTLWGKIVFRGVSSFDIASRPLYRMDLFASGNDRAGKNT